MLVLSRKIGERILIGEDIVITLLEFGRDKVRVGISAPLKTRILRPEHLDSEGVARMNAVLAGGAKS